MKTYPTWLTLDEAARLIGVSKATLRRRIAEAPPPMYRPGRGLRFEKASLQEWWGSAETQSVPAISEDAELLALLEGEEPLPRVFTRRTAGRKRGLLHKTQVSLAIHVAGRWNLWRIAYVVYRGQVEDGTFGLDEVDLKAIRRVLRVSACPACAAPYLRGNGMKQGWCDFCAARRVKAREGWALLFSAARQLRDEKGAWPTASSLRTATGKNWDTIKAWDEATATHLEGWDLLEGACGPLLAMGRVMGQSQSMAL